MADINGSDGTVRYTTKELLGRLDDKLDKVIDKLDQKVEVSDFVALRSRVENMDLHGTGQLGAALGSLATLQDRVRDVEIEQTRTSGVAGFKRWATPLAVGLGVNAVGWFIAIHYASGH